MTAADWFYVLAPFIVGAVLVGGMFVAHYIGYGTFRSQSAHERVSEDLRRAYEELLRQYPDDYSR